MHKLSKALVPVLLLTLLAPAFAAVKHPVAKQRAKAKAGHVAKGNVSRKPADLKKAAAPPTAPNVTQGCTPAEACLTPDECLDLYLVNEERKDHNLPALKLDETLVKVARCHSKDMADRGYFSHFEPVTKRDPVDRCAQAMGHRPIEVIGENLGMSDQPLMGLIHDSLMKSPTHRENILDHEYVRIGIGIYEARDGRTWLTEMFAGPVPVTSPTRSAKKD